MRWIRVLRYWTKGVDLSSDTQPTKNADPVAEVRALSVQPTHSRPMKPSVCLLKTQSMAPAITWRIPLSNSMTVMSLWQESERCGRDSTDSKDCVGGASDAGLAQVPL